MNVFYWLIPGIIYDVIVEPPSIGSTTDERGHSRPVCYLISLYCIFYYSPFFLLIAGSIHALQSQWSVHSWRFSIKLHVHNWRIGLRYPWSNTFYNYAQTESSSPDFPWIYLHSCVIFRYLDLHADEIAVSISY
jgi:hypothetical protein